MRSSFLILAIFIAIPVAGLASTKPKNSKIKSSSKVEMLPYFYCTTPEKMTDQVTMNDASGVTIYQGSVKITLPGDTYQEVWQHFMETLGKDAAKIGLQQLSSDAADRQPPLNIRALGPIVLMARNRHAFAVFRAVTSDGLNNIASRIQFFGDRDSGRQPMVVTQVYLVFTLDEATFGPAGAACRIQCWPVPCGILGGVPFDHRDSSELLAYLKTWLEGGSEGGFRPSPLTKAMKP